MRYVVDHDIHIHTHISPCSSDPEQNVERVLQHGVENHLRHICITDHFWDEDVPAQIGWPGYARLAENLPLPQAEGITFHFGCEADMNRLSTVGISKKTAEKFEFIIVPTTHLHIWESPEDDNATRRRLYLERWEALLNSDLPFRKMGLAHITWEGFAAGRECDAWADHLEILDSIPDDTFKRLFAKTEQLGMGVELNMNLDRYMKDGLDSMLRVFKIAIECGCHFYFGSDAHHPADFNGVVENRFEKLVDLLKLEEDQKFKPLGFTY